jgi:group I intron endonuclease
MFSISQRKQWPKTTGIYKIGFENGKIDKFYIGSTIKGFRQRWGSHLVLLNKQKHPSIRLQYAFNKYGASNIRFEILEIVNDFSLTIETEQKYIDHFNSYVYGYNATPIAGSQQGYKHRPEDIEKTKQKKWKKFEDLTPKIIELYNSGKNLKEVAKETAINYHTVSKILKSRKVSIKNLAHYRKITIYQYSLDGILIKEHGSAYEAANELNIHESNIRAVLKGKCVTSGGFFFSYEKKNPPEIVSEIAGLISSKKIKARENNIRASTPQKIEKILATRAKNNKPRKSYKRKNISSKALRNIHQFDLEDNLVKIWDTSVDIVKHYNMKNLSPILRVLKKQRKKFKNYKWKYEHESN